MEEIKDYTIANVSTPQGYVCILFEKLDYHCSERLMKYMNENIKDENSQYLKSTSPNYIYGFVCKKKDYKKLLKVYEDTKFV